MFPDDKTIIFINNDVPPDAEFDDWYDRVTKQQEAIVSNCPK